MTIVQLLMWYDISRQTGFPQASLYFLERIAEKLAAEGISYGDEVHRW